MLPKAERLTKEDFRNNKPKVFFRGNYIEIAIFPSTVFKCACVISKKRIQNAVERNTVKRKIYSIIESLSPLPLGNFIIYPKNISSTTPFDEIKKEISSAFATLQ